MLPLTQRPGEGPHISRLQMTDRHHKHHLTWAHTPILSHLNQRLGPVTYKINNCNMMKPRGDAFQASLSPHKLSLQAQLVFFFCKVTFIEYVTVWGCAAVFLIYFLNSMYKPNFECPTSFSCLRLTRPVQLLFTDTHSHLLAQLVVKLFAMVFNSRDQYGESFTFKTFGTLTFFS